ncbi:MAG: bifunctional diaminohydroxyphosphoribosylaminopyrimidine deaminase/5-amino-6-(5-phosphoribosylamino)uracil reductase RibD [Verrucomicrobiota bacterium]
MSASHHLRLALRLAQRGRGTVSPNPMVGAVLVKGRRIIGQGWHRRAGGPHAEIEALQDARRNGFDPRGATLFVTLEPCSSHGRTPPCTDAIAAAGIRRVVIGTRDPNPKHAGRAWRLLRRRGIRVESADATLARDCAGLNEVFNHWIVRRTPHVTVKSAMTLDGKIATASGESRWITGPAARAAGMRLRRGMDAILVGVNTILADDPSLTFRGRGRRAAPLRRIVLDSMARTPLAARVVSDEHAADTTIVVSHRAPRRRVQALAGRVKVLVSPAPRIASAASGRGIDLRWLLRRLGRDDVTSLLVEGGGEVNASFLLQRLAQRVVFFYAPKVLGGRDARKAVAGEGAATLAEALQLRDVRWRRLGQDWQMTAAPAPAV